MSSRPAPVAVPTLVAVPEPVGVPTLVSVAGPVAVPALVAVPSPMARRPSVGGWLSRILRRTPRTPNRLHLEAAVRTDKVLLIGAGPASAPVRALLADLPAGADVVVILRGSTTANLLHRDEFRRLLQRRDGSGRLHELVGSRPELRWDAVTLRTLVPDVSSRDVYVCGADRSADTLISAATRAGVPDSRIHREPIAC